MQQPTFYLATVKNYAAGTHTADVILRGATQTRLPDVPAAVQIEAADLADVLKALADPIRLRLVSIVATAPTGEACACDLPAAVERSQPTVSHHLSLLVEAGVLEREQRGKWAWFRLRPERLAELSGVLSPPTDSGRSPNRPST